MNTCSNRVILYYKNFITPGGAERLFIKEHDYFIKMGYDVHVITNTFSNIEMFGKPVKFINHVNLNSNGLFSIINLAKEIKNLGNPVVLCSSGDINIYLASLLTNFKYALHIHHPSFMSFDDFDKYSLFAKKHFKQYIKSNYGASRFKKIQKQLTTLQLIIINQKAIFSKLAKRKSCVNFVLSNYAKKEKKEIYGIDSEVLQGAIENINLKKKHRLKSKVFTILSVARLDKNKRIDVLIKSFKHIHDKYENINLIIVGSGPEEKKLKKLTYENKLNGKINFCGHISDDKILEIYSRANLFVSIDWADFKITLFESLNNFTPIIVSNETECDSEFIRMGIVKLITPSVKNLTAEIEAEITSPTIFKVSEVKKLLQKYTWNTYFYNVLSSLAARRLIPSPRRLCSI